MVELSEGGEELVPGPGEKGVGESQGCFRKNKEQGVEVNESQITGFVCANTVWPESLSKPLAWPELKVERCQGGGRGVQGH